MIWDPNSNKESDISMVSHVVAELTAAYGGKTLDPAGLQELVKAVELFLSQHCKPECVDTKYLVMLVSRALSSLGEGEAARRLLVFGTGMVRPAEWEVSRGQSMWILDLKRITVRSDTPLELTFFAGLAVVLECTADVWDLTRGSGTLGLKHVCQAATGLLCGTKQQRAISDLVGEIETLCERKLCQIGETRGWEAVPGVMNLDL